MAQGTLTAKTYSRTTTVAYTTKAEWDALFTGVIDTRTYTLPTNGICWKQTTDTAPPNATTAPAPLLDTGDTYHGWSAEGYIYIPTTGTYSFCGNSDDGCEIIINGTIVASCYNPRGAFASYELAISTTPFETITPIALSVGWYSFMAKTENGTGGYGFAVGWKKPGDSVYSDIPATQYDTTTVAPPGITYPYSIGSQVYGTTFTYVYSWYVEWYQYPTSTSYMTPTSNFTINSVTMGSPNATVNVTIYDSTAISRVVTAGYDSGVFTFSSLPTIRLYNTTLGTYVTVYATSLSTTVADGGSGSILHSQTLDVSVPATWFQSPNTTWNVQVSNLMTNNSVAVSQTNVLTSVNFIVPLSFNLTVRYADTLRPVLNMWVRTNDALVVVKSITVKKT